MFELLSVAQSEVWRAQRLAPDDPAYSVGGYVEIQGEVDRERLERAIRQVLEQADSCHYLFRDTDEGPRQILSVQDRIELPLVDFTDAANPRAQALAWMREATETAFDLTLGPLYRNALLKIAADRWIWVGVFHHLVTDFFGAILMLRSVAEQYTCGAHTAVSDAPRFTPWS